MSLGSIYGQPFDDDLSAAVDAGSSITPPRVVSPFSSSESLVDLSSMSLMVFPRSVVDESELEEVFVVLLSSLSAIAVNTTGCV